MINLLGNWTTFGKFRLWLTKPVFITNPEFPYYELMLLRKDDISIYYVDINNDLNFQKRFKFPPNPQKEGELPDSPDGIYRKEYEVYAVRKGFQQPLWYLHFSTVDCIIVKRLNELL